MKTLLAASLLLAGCATVANTPAQERGWARYEQCRHLLPADARIMRIDADGRVWVYGSTGRQDFYACYGRGGK